MLKNIIFEDTHIIVAKKPFGISVQKDKTGEKDLHSFIANYLNKDNKEIDLINRIDKPVGGLVIFSKNKNASRVLFKEIKNRNIEKKYLAVINGKGKEKDTLIDWIMKNQRLNISKIVCKNSINSKKAVLNYNNIKTITIDLKDLSLIDINLITGRHHQIRVQLANQNLPLWGDKKYGKEIIKNQYNSNLIALWAYKLKFKHPITNELLSFKVNPDLVYPFSLFKDYM